MRRRRESFASQFKAATGATEASAATSSTTMLMQSQSSTARQQNVHKAKHQYIVGKLLSDRVGKARQPRSASRFTVMHNRNTGEMLGLPVREGLQSLYKIARDKSIAECLLFVLLLACFIISCTLLFPVHKMYGSAAAISDLILDEEFPGAQYKKNFYEIMTYDEWWTWARGPLLNGLYPTEFYNGEPIPPLQRPYVLGLFRVVGGVSFRQLRVSNDSCSVRRFVENCVERCKPAQHLCNGDQSKWRPNVTQCEADLGPGAGLCCEGRFDTIGGVCYSEFTKTRQDTEPMVRPSRTYYWSGDNSNVEGLFGYGPEYGTGGYVTILDPLNRTAAEATLTDMFHDRWIDPATRAVVVTFSLYNTQSRILSVFRVLTEFYPDGNLVSSVKTYGAPLVVYQGFMDNLRRVVEIFFVLCWLFYLQKEAKRLYHTTPGRSPWIKFKSWAFKARTLYELSWTTVAAVLMAYYIQFVMAPVRTNFDVNSPVFVDYFPLAEAFIITGTIAGGLGLMFALQLFQYLGISRRFIIVWLTLYHAAKDLAAFLVSFLVLVSGFSFMGEMFFGPWIEGFRDFWFAASTLLRYPLGDFQYLTLTSARPGVAWLFFTLYVAMVFLVCMNLIIGIITKYFQEVHDDLKTSDKWKQSTVSLEAEKLAACARWWRLRRRMARDYCAVTCQTAFPSCCPLICCNARVKCCVASYVDSTGDDGEHVEFKGTSLPRALGGSGSKRFRRGTLTPGAADILNEPTKEEQEKESSKAHRFLQRQDSRRLPTLRRRATTNRNLDVFEQQRMAHADQLEKDNEGMANEAEFFALLRRCARAAKRLHDINLLRYFERVYAENATDFLYIGLMELCALTQPARGGVHMNPDALAVRLLTAYTKWKRVIIAGPARMHMRYAEEVTSFKDEVPKFEVKKISRKKLGMRQSRMLYVDEGRGLLYVFDKLMRLRRRLPLTQLIQIRRDLRNACRVALVFTSQGVPLDDEELFGGLETVLRVEFGRGDRVEKFVRVVRRVRIELAAEYARLQAQLGAGALEGMNQRMKDMGRNGDARGQSKRSGRRKAKRRGAGGKNRSKGGGAARKGGSTTEGLWDTFAEEEAKQALMRGAM